MKPSFGCLDSKLLLGTLVVLKSLFYMIPKSVIVIIIKQRITTMRLFPKIYFNVFLIVGFKNVKCPNVSTTNFDIQKG